jgi:hypothetical protein
MRSRHQVVEIDPIVGTVSVPPTRHVEITNDVPDVVAGPELDEAGSPFLIDETAPPAPVLRDAMGAPATATRRTSSAVPHSRPITSRPPTLPWGFGTDGWPRRNSRLVRLFACDPESLLAGVAGRTWGALSLRHDVVPAADDRWPMVIAGQLQMPYPSRPLEVELRVQPFHDRYCRVDVVLCSQHRWPRRYFDVASRCVTQMQRLERAAISA